MFIKFGEACEAFRKVIDSSTTGTAYTALKGLDQNTGCQISYVADLCLQLTEGLKRSSDVRMYAAHVESAYQSQVCLLSAQKLSNGTNHSNVSPEPGLLQRRDRVRHRPSTPHHCLLYAPALFPTHLLYPQSTETSLL